MSDEDEKIVEPFVFEEHVLPLEGKMLKKFLRWEWVDKERYEKMYSHVETFFDAISRVGYCKMNHEIWHPDYLNAHILRIYDQRLEKFTVNDRPQFLERDGSRITVIPVEKNGDEFNLKLEEHPQVEILPYGVLEVDYGFDVEISLGSRGHFSKVQCTKKVRKTEWNDSLMDRKTHYLFGEPGKIFYRPIDYFDARVDSCVMGECFYVRKKRNDLYIQGTIHHNGDFMYNGRIHSDGLWPFLIRKDKQDDGIKSSEPIVPEKIGV